MSSKERIRRTRRRSSSPSSPPSVVMSVAVTSSSSSTAAASKSTSTSTSKAAEQRWVALDMAELKACTELGLINPPNLQIISTQDPQDMKARLRLWAHAVALESVSSPSTTPRAP